jgi:hypothetical protein
MITKNFKSIEEPKTMKETIEEAVKTYYEENIDQSNIPREHYELEIQDLMLGFAYKWQKQGKNKFSEEEVIQILINYQHYLTTNDDRTADEWFENLKRVNIERNNTNHR